MEFTAKYIAEYLKGLVEGDTEVVISDVSRIEDGKPGTLTFLANSQYSKYIYNTNASVVIVNQDFVPEKPVTPTLIRVKDAYQAFATLLELYNQNKFTKTGKEDFCFVDQTAKIGENVYLGSFSYISENAVIGNNVKIFPQVFIGKNTEINENTILYPGVKVYHDCKIGANCIIHAGTVVGSDGFGFAPTSNQDFKKIPQLGNVIIEDNVEIGANAAIDRATMGSTTIRKGVKLDNLIQVAHNVEIGENTVISALAGISGSSKIGKNCMIGGQVGVSGHLHITDNVKIGAQAGIISDITQAGATILGSPAIPIKDYHRSYIYFKRLPDLSKKIDELTHEVEALKKQLNG
ncbi:MAG: UDP-3-O-(3-hydroxymyristoyl)glucosamine N-acyltransferase [Bacteroidia bacterium]|nr:UDP-3-O-(3-hydroxymyristoyl)glucosamine N-acyltransferase [Bacteroidia bacterium]